MRIKFFLGLVFCNCDDRTLVSSNRKFGRVVRRGTVTPRRVLAMAVDLIHLWLTGNYLVSGKLS